MILTANELTVLLLVFCNSLIGILLLPAFLELKKPKDNGPRIMPDFAPKNTEVNLLTNIDDEQKYDVILVHKIASIMTVLPDMEV